MAKFIYRMQNILDIKSKLEEQAKQNYMEVRSRLNDAEEILTRLQHRKGEYERQYMGLISSHLDCMEIEQCKNAIYLMDTYILEQKKVVQKIEIELEQAIRLMNEAMQERKIHEKLRENQFEVFKQELNAEEAKEIDELVSYTFNHKDTDEEV